MPLDSDFDALSFAYPSKMDDEAPPRTWEDVLALATKYDGAFNVTSKRRGDAPVRGFCAYCGSAGPSLGLFAVVAPILQSRGTAQGLFFDAATGAPRFETAAFKHGAALWKALARFTRDRDGCSRHDDFPECALVAMSPTKGAQVRLRVFHSFAVARRTSACRSKSRS